LLRWGLNALLLASVALVPCAVVWVGLVLWRTRAVGRTAALRSANLDVALLGSLAIIAVVGLRPGLGLDPGSEQWNWVPFRDLVRSFDGPGWGVQLAAANLAGNALLFLPLGLCLGLRFPRTRAWLLLIVVAAVSIGVEIGQALTATGRLSDVTDILMNMTGGLIGVAVAGNVTRLTPCE